MTGKRRVIPVGTRALAQRINRRLEDKGWKLKKARGQRARADVGDWYVIDVNRNVVKATHINLEAAGREFDALDPWEYWDDSEWEDR